MYTFLEEGLRTSYTNAIVSQSSFAPSPCLVLTPRLINPRSAAGREINAATSQGEINHLHLVVWHLML